jgi:MFS family permease
MNRALAVRELWHEPQFAKLLATRLTSQTSDGLLQASLAGAVIFNPEHHPGPARVAAGFVVLLLPYSLIGPFAGVLLDRWQRQRVLVYGAAVRAALVAITAITLVERGPSGAAFVLSALAALAVNRFYLAALSAALPSVVSTDRLVLANAVSPTSGTVVTIMGGGLGLILRAVGGGGDHGDALAAAGAAAGYLLAAYAGSRLPVTSLGPHPASTDRLRAQLATVVRGLRLGVRHLTSRPVAGHALGVLFAQRFVFGVWSIMALLLYRNYFDDHGVLRDGLGGVAQAVTIGGVGLVTAAAITPAVTARLGRRRWIATVTVGVAVTQFVFGAPFTLLGVLATSLTLGFANQATKVCVDTLVQTNVDDEFRGRIFSLYDTAYNLSFVIGATAAAFILPSDGRSISVLAAMSVAYLAVAGGYELATRRDRRDSRRLVPEQPAEQPA